MDKDKKRISLKITSNVNEPTQYTDFLFRSSEQSLIIDFAVRNEDTEEVVIEVRDSVAVPAEKMRDFLARLLTEMIDYEKEFKNGKGLIINQSNREVDEE